MNEVLQRVFLKKDEIINMTMVYQNSSRNSDSDMHSKDFSKLHNYFDQHFNDDEIMVIQCIMYFGRECYTGSGDEYAGTKEEVISEWMNNMSFSFGKIIDKDIEIYQMVGKAQKIGTYFKCGFEELERR